MKYKITENFIKIGDIKLYQIQALKDFGDVKAGDLGGWIEKEANLSQNANCWVYDDGKVFGNAFVSENARVGGGAWVCGEAVIEGETKISEGIRK